MENQKYEIHYNNRTYTVNKEDVCLSSRLLRKMVEESPNFLEMEADIDPVHFETFLNVIQGKDFEFTPENIEDIKSLADAYQVKKLLAVIRDQEPLILSPENILMNAINLTRNKQSIDKYIPVLASNISKLINIPQLSLLPVEEIDKIFSAPECNPKDQAAVIRFFEALLTLKNQKKENSSFLFHHIDFTKLNFEDIEHILSIRDLRKSDIIDQISETATKLIEIISAEATQNEEQINNQQNEITEMEAKIKQINSQKESIEKHHSRAKRRYEEACQKVKENRGYMFDVERKLSIVKGAPIPPQVQPSTETTRKRANRFVEWCEADFPDEGPTPKVPTRSTVPKRTISNPMREKQTVIRPMQAIRPVSFPTSTAANIKIEKPKTKITNTYSPISQTPAAPSSISVQPPYKPVVEPQSHSSSIKVEKPPKPLPAQISGIKIEKPNSTTKIQTTID